LPADYTPRRSDDELLAVVYGKIAARRQHREFFGVGVGALAMFILATGVAVAGNGGSTKHTTTVADAPSTTTSTAPETTTTSIVADTTTTTAAAPPSTAVPVSAAPTTITAHVPSQVVAAGPSPAHASAPVTARALLAQAWPPSRDQTRVYVSAQGEATGGYVSRMTLSWGDGTAPRTFQYTATACQDPTPSRATDVEAANDNHRYAQAGTYTVELIVTATSCDGSTSQQATNDITVTDPPSQAP
jgi:hypothetical protein